MWKIIKEDSDDLGFAIKCLFSQSIDLNEFKLWIEQVITKEMFDGKGEAKIPDVSVGKQWIKVNNYVEN